MSNRSSQIPGPDPHLAIGVVAPFDMELDAELWRWVPAGVDLLVTRTPFVDDEVTVEFAQQLSDDAALSTAVRSVTAGRARTVAYACTSASFVGGADGEARIRGVIETSGAAEAVTTSGAVSEALSALGVRNVAVATPYLPELSRYLDRFLAEHGVSVVEHASLGLGSAIWEVPYARTAELVRGVDRPEAEAIVISCTNLPTYDLIGPLERELGKPVISANQATIWAVLRRLGREAIGPGQRLLER